MSDMTEKQLHAWLRDVQGINVDPAEVEGPAAALGAARDAVHRLSGALPFEAEPSAFLKALDDLADER